MISLCLYDGMLSLVMLAHSSLLADITLNSKERAECNMWNSGFSLAGSFTVLFAQFFWDKSNFGSFQLFCTIIAILSAGIFIFTSFILQNEFKSFKNEPKWSEISSSASIPSKGNTWQRLHQYWNELLKLPNFWIFMVINLVQVFNCHFNSNFLSITMERLLQLDQEILSSRQISAILLTSSALFPHLLVILLTPIQKKYGLYTLLKGLFIFKFVAAFFVFIFGSVHHWNMILVFLFVNKV